MADDVALTVTKNELPIEVIGSDLDGRQFIERVKTLTVQREGGTIRVASKLAPDCEVIIHNLNTHKEALARVVGQIRQEAGGHVYAISFVDGHTDLWGVPLPSAALPTSVVLECSRCRTVVEHSLSEIEMQVFSSRHDLMRLCTVCRASTVWKETTRKPTAEPQPTPSQQRPAPATAHSRGEEQRKHRRTTMRTPAFVRCSGQEELVNCEDVSRGGFRFLSRTRYPEGTHFEAAVPYTESGNNIFARACIVYSSKTSSGRFRHGAAYIKT